MYPNLIPHQKWFKMKKDIRPGDIILLVSFDTSRSQWSLGRILEYIQERMVTYDQSHYRLVKNGQDLYSYIVKVSSFNLE